MRTTEWENIKANMPWLLDAIVCVALDLFVSFSSSIHIYSSRSIANLEIVKNATNSLTGNGNRSYCSTYITDASEERAQMMMVMQGQDTTRNQTRNIYLDFQQFSGHTTTVNVPMSSDQRLSYLLFLACIYQSNR